MRMKKIRLNRIIKKPAVQEMLSGMAAAAPGLSVFDEKRNLLWGPQSGNQTSLVRLEQDVL